MFYVVINMKTANALGIAVRPTLLAAQVLMDGSRSTQRKGCRCTSAGGIGGPAESLAPRSAPFAFRTLFVIRDRRQRIL
jgi:hypothetical protein